MSKIKSNEEIARLVYNQIIIDMHRINFEFSTNYPFADVTLVMPEVIYVNGKMFYTCLIKD